MKSKNNVSINLEHIQTVIRTASVIFNTYKNDPEMYAKMKHIIWGHSDNTTKIDHLRECITSFNSNDPDRCDEFTALNNEVMVLVCAQAKMLNPIECEIAFRLIQSGMVRIEDSPTNVEEFIKKRFATLTEEEAKDPIIQTIINLVK